MKILEEKYVDPREVKEVLEKYQENQEEDNVWTKRVLDNLDDIMDISPEKIEKLKEIIPEEKIYKIIEINPKNEEQVKLIVGDKYKEVCEILFGE